MKTFEIRQRETGILIEGEIHSIIDAINTIKDYELEDDQNGDYEEDFYEIYDSIEEKVLSQTDILREIQISQLEIPKQVKEDIEAIVEAFNLGELIEIKPPEEKNQGEVYDCYKFTTTKEPENNFFTTKY